MKKAVILLSGGMDSLVTTAIANQENDELYFLHANYGQITQTKEQECFNYLVQFYSPKDILTVDLNYLKQIGGTSLIGKGDKIENHDPNKEQFVPSTYVPFRNGNLIVIATSWAEVIGAQSIYIGAVEEDSSGYPDCRESFYLALNKAIQLGTKDDTNITIKTPIIHKSKAEIIKLGKELQAPFEYSWSCYRNNEVACGTCDSCYLRLKAFREAGLKDPIPYIDVNKKANYKQSSWAGGTTTELFIYPLDSSYHTRNFDVRISSATVEIEKSVFTSLPDYNRSLMVIEGNLEIKHQGHYSKNLIPFECDNFDGAWNTSSLGQARDFNLMTSKNLKGELSYQEKEAKHKFKLENRCNNLFVGIYLISGKLISNDRKQCIESEDLLILTKLNEIIELQALERSKIIYIYVSK